MNSSIQQILIGLNTNALWHRSVKLWGNRYTAPSADRLLAIWLYKVGLLGKKEVKFFSTNIQKGMNVVDVGANQGLFSLLFSKLVGTSGEVFAFEPEPNLYKTLGRNLNSNNVSNVQHYPFALGNDEKDSVLFTALLNSGDNRMNDSSFNRKKVEIRVRRMDSLLAGKRIDFIKIDVQGHELATLKGMDRVLTENPAVKIYFEFWPHGLLQAKTEPQDIFDFFQKRGFSVFRSEDQYDYDEEVVPDTLIAQLKGTAYTNLLAARKS